VETTEVAVGLGVQTNTLWGAVRGLGMTVYRVLAVFLLIEISLNDTMCRSIRIVGLAVCRTRICLYNVVEKSGGV
jgi:hypothetical protein